MVAALVDIDHRIVQVLDCYIEHMVAEGSTDSRRHSVTEVCYMRPMELHYQCSNFRPMVHLRHQIVC
jgi:hypothetical protein